MVTAKAVVYLESKAEPPRLESTSLYYSVAVANALPSAEVNAKLPQYRSFLMGIVAWSLTKALGKER